MSAAAVAEPQSAFLKEPELVIGVQFTGVRKSASGWRLLYVPPLTLAECLTRILEDVRTDPWKAGLINIAANPELALREPPCLRQAIMLHSAAKGEGRWPLAYLSAHVGRIDFPALRQAFRDHRRPA
jgi:hypothetical protein